MRVRAKLPDQLVIPPEIEPYCRQRFITGGKEYEVHAMVACLHASVACPHEPPRIHFQIVDDERWPAWLPHLLFEIVDGTVAPDWCSNILDVPGTDARYFVIGPEFLVRDVAGYYAMVELEADQVDLFWKRIESIEKAREEQRWLEELERQEGEGE